MLPPWIPRDSSGLGAVLTIMSPPQGLPPNVPGGAAALGTLDQNHEQTQEQAS